MSPLLLLLCSCIVTLASSITAPGLFLDEHAHIHFEQFIKEHNKEYVNEDEKQTRFEIFKENLKRANIMNQHSKQAVFGITKFMDLTQDEFLKGFTGLRVTPPAYLTDHLCNEISDSHIPDYDAPASYDWRQNNAVTRVKNQGQCGSCYAFSTTGNIEGQYAIKYGTLIELSEQQIVDCDKTSFGCNGGYMAAAFRSIIEQGGIESEADYSYAAVQQTCQFTPGKADVRLTDCDSYHVVSQKKLTKIVYKVGPISVGVQATSFQAYTGGIMSDQECNAGEVNHAVLLVGYGTENGTPYWIIKNSWGEDFGEQGYIRIQRGENALSCGMMNNGLMASSIVM